MKEDLILFSTFADDEVSVPAGVFERKYVTKLASEYFGCEVICKPGILIADSTALAWQIIEEKTPFAMLGYFVIAANEIVTDFRYGVNAFIPLSPQTAHFGCYDANYEKFKINLKKR